MVRIANVMGMASTCSWIFGAGRKSIRACVTRARVMSSRRAMSAWVGDLPESDSRCQAWPCSGGSKLVLRYLLRCLMLKT